MADGCLRIRICSLMHTLYIVQKHRGFPIELPQLGQSFRARVPLTVLWPAGQHHVPRPPELGQIVVTAYASDQRASSQPRPRRRLDLSRTRGCLDGPASRPCGSGE
jgi:hypothetical protein